MGASQDFEYEGTRRMIVNGCYWAVGLEDKIPDEVERGPRGRVQADAVPVQEERGVEAGREAGGAVQVRQFSVMVWILLLLRTFP